MSPFSYFLHDLRMRHEIRQSELAELLGYEQSYISALEIGVKGPPTAEFVERVIEALALTPIEQIEIREVMAASQRKLVLDSDSSQDLYWMFKELREQMNVLHPAQIKMIRDVLGLTGSFADAQPEPIRRIKRRRKEEARM
ncbi:helix-turn-helix domain-containing protein [Collimonas humicola]|uniref:helix-turn-helix domain-containing protein n=1 Tax=Collimonas humicola TaxID=2825886 RepID=UPI001B8B948E|nr:helix-turn-helix transcriptional regulator [Collimonas humicola]